MIKQAKFAYKGMNRDVARSKHPFEFYYEGYNINIVATDTQSTFAVENERGNAFTLELPQVTIDTTFKQFQYGGETLQYRFDNITVPEIEQQINDGALPTTSGVHTILGHAVTRDSIILISTDGNGFDAIWEVEELLEGGFNLKLLYARNLCLSVNNPVQILYNYENDAIQKIYWVDGLNQLRQINIKQSIDNGDIVELIDVDSSTINAVGNFEIAAPIVTNTVQGGTHTAGRIQYAYNLYNLNGGQTKLSPLTELVSLNKGENLGGGDVDEVVGTIPVINIQNIDPQYTHIQLYGVKYTSLNQTPQISLLIDSEVNSTREVTYLDDGSTISDLSLAEFLFLGSDPYIPRHIESKDNILFMSNYKNNNFDIDLDFRAFAHSSSGLARIYDNVVGTGSDNTNPQGVAFNVPPSFIVPEKHDAINLNYDFYKYQADGTTLGGEGKYLKYELKQNTLNQDDLLNPTFFKDREVYRIAIEFYNILGQTTVPYWIADFVSLDGNLEGLHTSLEVTLKPEFFVWLNTNSSDEKELKPVGYRLLRAKRDLNDRTIVCQGIINSMVANYAHNSKLTNLVDIQNITNSREAIKMPSLMRSFVPLAPVTEYKDHHDLAIRNTGLSGFGAMGGGALEEVPKYASSSDWRAQTFQYNRMMQMFSPEITFSDLTFNANSLVKPIGLAQADETSNWSAEVNVNSGQNGVEAKFINGYNRFTPGVTEEPILSDPGFLMDRSFFGIVNSRGATALHQVYKNYDGFIRSNTSFEYDVYGTPELSQLGETFRNYNGDANLRYTNNLTTMLVDAALESDFVNDDAGQSILGSQSNGHPAATFVLGADDPTTNMLARNTLEGIFTGMSIPRQDGALIGEIILPEFFRYLGSIYGGNTYEDKRRTEYVKIGQYQDINTTTYEILNPGDTYVQRFTFKKLCKTGVDLSTNYTQVTEIVSVVLESNIDLKNRNDLSLQEWDAKFQPNFEEYHKYNTVYSQQNILTSTSDVGFKFKEVENFDTRIIASKVKVPGEFIDSWTDFQVNETMDLDGKYGPINSIINFNDNLYAIQDTGVAYLNINPRIQTQASDGIAIELGTGDALYDYNYLTTKSGTINKWSVVSTPNGFYYLDGLNKSYYTMQGGRVFSLSDGKHLHTYFENNVDYDIIKNDNHILNMGVSTGYDHENREIYLTLRQGDASFTIKYNEKLGEFVSLYGFKPAFYINKGFRLLTTGFLNNDLWEHGVGEYNSFYSVKDTSHVILLVNPEADMDCVFNNVMFKSQLYIDGVDQPDKTITHIQAYNEYQDSGKTELVLGRSNNLRRKFRKWQANIPREGRDRIRNPWIFLKLELDNPENRQLILHDIIVNYTPY